VKGVEDAGSLARTRAQTMRENGQAYINKWQNEMDTIQDPTIKANLAQRRDAVRANFESIRNAASSARDAYDPFLSDLKQIQKALEIDQSPAALPGLKPAFGKAHDDGATLKQRISALQAELNKIQTGMGAPPK
jgi:hypothetical protein